MKIDLGPKLGSGNYGSVFWAQAILEDEQPPTLCVAKCATPGNAIAADYLAVEAHVNPVLRERGGGAAGAGGLGRLGGRAEQSSDASCAARTSSEGAGLVGVRRGESCAVAS